MREYSVPFSAVDVPSASYPLGYFYLVGLRVEAATRGRTLRFHALNLTVRPNTGETSIRLVIARSVIRSLFQPISTAQIPKVDPNAMFSPFAAKGAGPGLGVDIASWEVAEAFSFGTRRPFTRRWPRGRELQFDLGASPLLLIGATTVGAFFTVTGTIAVGVE